MASLLYILALVCFPTLSLGLCPELCSCDSIQHAVKCQNVHTTGTLYDILSAIPDDTIRLEIEGGLISILPTSPTDVLFPKMRYLRISETKISTIGPVAFMCMPHLKELHLDHNEIEILDPFHLAPLGELQILDLSSNAIRSVNTESFQEMANLIELDISSNNITNISSAAFQNLYALKLLNLRENTLRYIHPSSFNNLTNLATLNLEHNKLDSLHEFLGSELSNLKEIHLQDNPWECHCGVQWIVKSIQDSQSGSNKLKFPSGENVRCNGPIEVKEKLLQDLRLSDLKCAAPYVVTDFNDTLILTRQNRYIHCRYDNDTYPDPTVYWVTPHGVLSNSEIDQRWLPYNVTSWKSEIAVRTQPLASKSRVKIFKNGTLLLQNFKYYFTGEYTCFVVNPKGMDSRSGNVSIYAVIEENVVISIAIGFATAGAVLLIGIIVGSIQMCAEYLCCKDHKPKVIDTPAVEYDDGYIDYYESPCASGRGSPSRYTPYDYESPMKCVTPAEGHGEIPSFDLATDIKETLIDIKNRISISMERNVERMRAQAAHAKENSARLRRNTSKTLENIKENSTNTFKTLQRQSSQSAKVVKASLAHSMEHMKKNVKSMKEFCGTGELPGTMSVASVSTDVDSAEKSESVKKHTFV